MEKKERVRYIVFQNGEFIETVHNKESYYVSTHEETEPGKNSQNNESKQSIENSQKRTIYRSVFNVSVLAALAVGFIILFNSFETKLEESLPYLNTQSPEQINDASTNEATEVMMDAQLVNELSYILHTHHAINSLYEEAKTSVSKYANGSISKMAFETELTNIANKIKTLMAYNDAQIASNSDLIELHQTTSVRLNFLLELLREVVTTKSRVMVIEVLNEGIELDQPLFNSKLTNFKSILNTYQIPYTESDRYLSFEFPR